MNTNGLQLPDKPRPESPPEHETWWKALTEHRLVAQRCTNCQRKRLYPRPMCDVCYSLEHDWVDINSQGTVHSWSVSHHAFNPGFKKDLPYTTVTVDLDEGLRLHAPLRGIAAKEVSIGMPVLVDYEDVDESYTRLFFRCVD